jgi:GNAT superfamily N-acetyltransferase
MSKFGRLLRLARRRRIRFGVSDNTALAAALRGNPHDAGVWGMLADSLRESGAEHWADLAGRIGRDGWQPSWVNPGGSGNYRMFHHPDLVAAHPGLAFGGYTAQPVVQGVLHGLGAKVGLVDYVDDRDNYPQESPPSTPMAMVDLYHKPPTDEAYPSPIGHAIIPAHEAQGLMHELARQNQGKYLQGFGLPGSGRWVPPEQRSPAGVHSVLARRGRPLRFADAFGNVTHHDFLSDIAGNPDDLAHRGAYADFLDEGLFGPRHKPGDQAVLHILRKGLEHGFEPVPRPSATNQFTGGRVQGGQAPDQNYVGGQLIHGHLEDPRTGRHYWVASHPGAAWVHAGVTEEFPEHGRYVTSGTPWSRTGMAHHGVVLSRQEAADWARSVEEGMSNLQPDMAQGQAQVPYPVGRVMTPTAYHDGWAHPLTGALRMATPIELEHTDPSQRGPNETDDEYGARMHGGHPDMLRRRRLPLKLQRLLRFAASPLLGIEGESALHPQEFKYLHAGEYKQRYHEGLASSLAGRPGVLPTHREMTGLFHAGVAAQGGYEGVEHLARVLTPEDAAVWGVASGIVSPRVRWEQHTGAGLAVLGEWINAGRPHDPTQILGAIERARTRKFLDPATGKKTSPWAYALSPKASKKKLVAFLSDHARHLAGLGTDRTFLGQGWKAPNFATASMPFPYGDTQAVPIDYTMGLLTSPGHEQFRMGLELLKRERIRKNAKRLAEGKASLGPYDPGGRVHSALEDLLSGVKSGRPTHRVVEAIAELRPGVHNSESVDHKLVATLKKAQEKIWTDPQYSLAFKSLAAQVAREHGVDPRQAMERQWAVIAAVMGAKDLPQNAKRKMAQALTHESVAVSWNPMEVLADGAAAAEFTRAGVKPGDLQSFKDAVAEASAARTAETGHGRLGVRGRQQAAFEDAARRIPPGLGQGGQAAARVLGRLARTGRRLRFAVPAGLTFRVEPVPGGHGADSYESDEGDAYSIHAQVGGQPVGRADVNVLPDHIHVRWVEVHPAHRRKGVAAGLLDHAEQMWPGRGMDTSGFTDEGENMRHLFARQVGLHQSVTVARSSSSLAVARAVSHALTRLGLAPHQVTRAVLNAGGKAVPAAVAAIHSPNVPDLSRIGGAGWLGLMQRLPGAVAFTSDPNGPDRLHRIDHQGPVSDLTQRLQAAGAYTHVLIPGKSGTVALVYDRGGRLGPSLAQAGLRLSTAAGHGMPLEGRQQLRDATRAPEAMG